MNIEKYYDNFISYVTDIDRWILFGGIVLKIILILIAARVVIGVSNAAINRIFMRREEGRFQRLRMDPRRSETMRTLTSNIAKYTIYFVAFFNIFLFFGYNPQPLLASAGVLGLAIGFGAQNLVRDIITGFFIIFEDQFAVGDVITINNVTGTVQEIGLRITRIKVWTGEVHIIPNGSIKEVTNLSIENSVAVVDVSVSYNEDISRVLAMLEEAAPKWKDEMEEIVETPSVLGVEQFGPSDIVIRVIAECQPLKHIPVMRKLRAEIKEMFDKKGIEIPYPHMVMVSQQDGLKTDIQSATKDAEQAGAKQSDNK
ncbi:mechanosensitive ion channel family protein [Aneurinibacillus tyrosinisolvens]|uniref:mechanosensitive ion channel family protein n=1 Tax=Aneurinibacillus tyrosinisolvens TaxID=1443435 RepID=UPI000AF60B38|nr:mechanosensitive ion channel family protein [Aneurinibacillus tyrosinisolvens]